MSFQLDEAIAVLERTPATFRALGHLAQTTRVMLRRFREAVEPWRAYLPIVTR